MIDADRPPVVQLAPGAVRGVVEGGAAVFRGIPYAAPPFGALRFAAPAPPVPWEGERDCSAFAATAPKPPYGGAAALLLPEPAIPGEDCLTLNVWTPDPGASGLPVFVWVHGGSFQNGSGAVPTYSGAAFARDGVVAVTLNYRLGVDGFAALPDAVANRGLLDQIAALEWVRDNIASFGGDPGRVTVAGESAGAMSVTSLMAAPPARGLFARAIAQSGAGHHVLSPETASRVSAAVAERLGVEPTAAALAGVPVPDLVAAQAAVTQMIAAIPDPERWREITANAMPFEPVVDGAVVPGRPIDVLAAGRGAPVDVLTGSNDDEMGLFLGPTGYLDGVDEATVRGALAALGAPAQAYGTYLADAGDARPGSALSAAMTDWYFRVPALRLAEAQAGAGQRAWVYEFGWPTPVLDGALGSCHALEVPFAFDTLGVPGGGALAGDAPPQELADAVHAAWVAFVRDGDPGWAPYGGDRATRRFGGPGDGEVVLDPGAHRRELWERR